jgi:ribosomal protein S12 methylthiotransferase accessory factor
MGITRIANVTGLDSIGIPVVMVCRPNSRSLAVSQGKGIDLATARASGVMESVEVYHGEQITLPLRFASYAQLRYTHPIVDLDGLPRTAHSLFHPHLTLLWIEGHDLLENGPRWLPYEVVSTNYTVPPPPGSGCFGATSNGLAAGNHLLEAVSHGVCEVIERDATTLWSLLDEDARRRTRVDLATVDDPDCRQVLDRYAEAGVEATVWETTTDVGVPTFLCQIGDRSPTPLRALCLAAGTGCHPTREVALLRALTEAAQSRLTFISGTRDDCTRDEYECLRSPDTVREYRAMVDMDGPRRRFGASPTFASDTFDEDLAWLLDRLAAVGIEQVVAVDLTKPEFRVPVVRVVIPGLEGPEHRLPGYVAGRRARRLLARA